MSQNDYFRHYWFPPFKILFSLIYALDRRHIGDFRKRISKDNTLFLWNQHSIAMFCSLSITIQNSWVTTFRTLCNTQQYGLVCIQYTVVYDTSATDYNNSVLVRGIIACTAHRDINIWHNVKSIFHYWECSYCLFEISDVTMVQQTIDLFSLSTSICLRKDWIVIVFAAGNSLLHLLIRELNKSIVNRRKTRKRK